MDDHPGLLTDSALERALNGSGLEEAFERLPSDDRRFYRGWVEGARSEEELLQRVRALIRILHISNKAL